VTQLAALAEEGVDLRQGQPGDRVVAVDVDRQHVDAGRQGRRLVAEARLELVDLLLLHLAAHRAEGGRAADQRRRRRRRALALDRDLDIRVDGPEALGPQGHEVVQGVGADTGDGARDAGHGLVLGQGRVDGHLSTQGDAAQDGGGGLQ